jgi:DNA repair protein RadD
MTSVKPRPYQVAAIRAIPEYFEQDKGIAPLIVMPTATGKSHVIAGFCEVALKEYNPYTRILIGTHVKELVRQDFEKMIKVWKGAPAGLYSAGLKKRQAHSQILFGGIQSIYDKADIIGRVDLLLVDEAHTIPKDAATNEKGMWKTLINRLLFINPRMKIVGFTATDYRLKGGRLHIGDGALFDGIAYEYPISEAIAEGYVCRPIGKKTDTRLSVAGVGKSGGDFKEGDLQRAVNVDATNKAAVREMIQRGANRKKWIVFCAGIDHTIEVAQELNNCGIKAVALTSLDSPTERDDKLAAYANDEYQAICNMGILTTGYDEPRIDLVACLRPTMSPGLWVQMCGRGFRPLFADGTDMDTTEGRLAGQANGPKPNFLVLDFAGNTDRHGPLDKITPPPLPGEKEGGPPPMKICPQCDEYLHASTMTCYACGYEFPRSELPDRVATEAAILSTEAAPIEPEWRKLLNPPHVQWHQPKGKTASLKIVVPTFGNVMYDWLHPHHHGKANTRTAQKMQTLGAENIDDIQKILNDATHVYIRNTKPYAEILGYKIKGVDRVF